MTQVTPDQLIDLGRDISPPVDIALADGPCRITEIYRLLPGRRLAARGSHQGRDVLVKLFFGRGARRSCARDRRGVAMLRASGVSTPELLEETTTAQPGGFALLFQFLASARPIATGESVDAADHAALAVEALARLHGHGVTHQDAHLDNFMVSGGSLYIVDGAGVRQLSSALGEPASLRALAAFLAEYSPAEDHRVAALLMRYATVRGWPEVTGRLQRLRRALAAARRRRVRRYLAKTERACTAFHCERAWRRVCLAKRHRWSAALAGFATDPEVSLATAEVVKSGRSATVFRLRLNGENVVVKRYNVKSTLHRLRRWFKPRARIAWRNGHRLALLGIPAADPIALIERRWGPLRAESWLVMPDYGTLDIQAEVETRGWTEPLLNRVARIFCDLKAAGLQHGDTKASNFLVRPDEVRLVDLDGLREYPGSALDIARFLENFDADAQAKVRDKFAAAGLIAEAGTS